MRCKPSALGGTGLAAVAGALILAASPAAFAQMYGSPATANPPSQQMQMQMQKATAPAEKGATKPLSRVSDPSTTLASATVSDSSGQSVGQVQSVKTSASGKATSVAVSLSAAGATAGAPKVVSIKADDLTYDPSSNSLKASLTTQEINQLPSIQSP
ncbi:MAG TPA: hypothetical protein VKB71_12920 [Rhizomicrobium sp.]|nr:hypothetical protein [Rhizomicrobium sp.]